MLTKGCCKGNNYEQCFALDTFPADFSWRNVLAKPCILLFTLQQDCNTREACRLLLVVKVVFVVFPNSGGRIANSTNPITRFSGWTPFMWFTFKTSYCSSPKHIEKQRHFTCSFPKTDTNDKNRECTLCVGLAQWEWTWLQYMAATQSKPSQHDPSLIVHIPYFLLANKNQKCDKKVSKPRCECQAKSL